VVQTDLVAFLLACIEEDEQTARDEQERREAWHAELDAMMRRGQVPSLAINEYNNPGAPGDPARVLVECDTKRRIIESYRSAWQPVDETAGPQWKAMVRAERSVLLEVLRFMALPYREREGYRSDWDPDGR
jgi:hypothetical protein